MTRTTRTYDEVAAELIAADELIRHYTETGDLDRLAGQEYVRADLAAELQWLHDEGTRQRAASNAERHRRHDAEEAERLEIIRAKTNARLHPQLCGEARDLAAELDREQAAGLRAQRRARQTGTLVGLYDGIAAGMDTDAGRWQTVCEDHGTICSHETLATAESFLSYPLEWCEECMHAPERPT